MIAWILAIASLGYILAICYSEAYCIQYSCEHVANYYRRLTTMVNSKKLHKHTVASAQGIYTINLYNFCSYNMAIAIYLIYHKLSITAAIYGTRLH